MKRTIIVLLLLAALCLTVLSAAAEAPLTAEDYLGQPFPDFTVQTITGETFTLSETLKEKKAVLINLWATWCGPCENEFPFMEEAYEAYKDDIAIIALSVEENDTYEILIDYADSHGMTFDVASDTGLGFGDIFATQGIPTTVAVDRFGNVCLIEVGSQTSAGAFTGLFDELISDEYTETRIFDSFPQAKPNVEGASAEELASDIAPDLAVNLPEDEYAWPFVITEIDGETCAESTNAGIDNSYAGFDIAVDAAEGDALIISYKLSCEYGYDGASFELNGERVRRVTGETEWEEYAVKLNEGANTVSVKYIKDPYEGMADDKLYIKNIRLASGEEAQAALEAAPAYDYADATAFTVLGDGAKELILDEAYEGAFTSLFGDETFNVFIVYSDTADVSIAIGGEYDAESVYVYSNYDNSVTMPADIESGVFTTGIDSMETSGYSSSSLMLMDTDTGETYYEIMLIRDEANASALVSELRDEYGVITGAHFADGTPFGAEEAEETEEAAEEAAELVWTAVFTDQDGNPVPGCVINFCDDASCTPVFSDENGEAVFTSQSAYPWHLQVIKVPEGYAFDTAQEFTADENGGEMSFTVTKE